ncbi:kinase-like protein [Obba rivulosa]|uniref:Kinase-like protein n=1 Tax=Obba rivulosa TaxID=1052685 RepID=A0A8E2ALH9_9APHY|nr:kinase-like protein [Obba rivulosa]
MANATGPEAAFLVELLDKVSAHSVHEYFGILTISETLDSAESQGPFRRLCFRVLKTLCIKNQIFPQSFFLPSAALQRSRQWPQAAGGFANVYMGTYEGRQVAIKVVRAAEIPEMNTAHAQILKDICKEAIVWKYLRHPNVTPFYGIDTTMFPVSFVCQWMPHDTVNAYLCERPAANRIKLLSDVAEGVNYLHSMDCLHGDLKGSNILISSKHEACLSDFGLATLRRGDSSANVAATSMTSGTFRWTAPELLDPEKFGFERAIPTPESDIYSFSMVMLEIFTGKFPFHNLSTDASVIVRVLQGVRPLRPLQATPLGLSDKLWSLMEQCWDADRQKRPPATVVLQLLRDTAQNPLAEPETWPLDLKSGL